jgi:hypothetical protein
MTDFYLKKFYQDVKDESWSDISTYNDVLDLPLDIQTEMNVVHGLDKRLSEVESIDYWRKTSRHTSTGYKKNNVIFVPVLKCGSTYYHQLFLNQFHGWEIVNLYDQNWDQVKVFGCIMHPLTRRLKGITELLFKAYQCDANQVINDINTNAGLRAFIARVSVCEDHTMPYTTMFGDLLEKINWIPAELGKVKVINYINDFLKFNGVTDQVDELVSVHASSPGQLKLYELVVKLYLENEDDEFPGIKLFADDLKFYHQLVRKYNLLENTPQ